MAELRLNHFLTAIHDFERAQYTVMEGLTKARRAFSKNIVYPYLSSLVNLYDSLQQIVSGMDIVEKGLPRRLEDIDLNSYTLKYDYQSLDGDQLAVVKELVSWTMPLLQDAIEEGRTIFEFVEENLSIGEVGLIPAYVEEGYLLIPNLKEKTLHILKYDVSLFTDAKERYRSLRTAHVKTIPSRIIKRSPHSIKLELIEENRALPNPATYMCDTEIAFPYEETVLPIAKRKLMRYLYTQGGLA